MQKLLSWEPQSVIEPFPCKIEFPKAQFICSQLEPAAWPLATPKLQDMELALEAVVNRVKVNATSIVYGGESVRGVVIPCPSYHATVFTPENCTAPATLAIVGVSLPLLAAVHGNTVGSTTCMSNATGCHVAPSQIHFLYEMSEAQKNVPFAALLQAGRFEYVSNTGAGAVPPPLCCVHVFAAEH